MTERLKELKKFLTSYFMRDQDLAYCLTWDGFLKIQTFYTRNTVGDDMYTIYSENGINVDYCGGYQYLEIFGLTDEEQEVFCEDGDYLILCVVNIPTIDNILGYEDTIHHMFDRVDLSKLDDYASEDLVYCLARIKSILEEVTVSPQCEEKMTELKERLAKIANGDLKIKESN